ncbi:MAG TPA: TetR/AcrR family transcriptional regulator [Thermoleophilaceae bacterium]
MPRSSDPRDVQQLPPGRHGLSRKFVVENQRERILAAVADVTSAASYVEMTVEDIIVCAGISRRTFYEHFKNKEAAFLAAYDAIVAQLFADVLAAIDAETGFPARVRAGLGAFLEFVADEPAFARMCIVEVLSAGPEAVLRRGAAMSAFAQLLQENATSLLDDTTTTPLTSETIVGGIYEVLYTRVLRGEIRQLPDLLPDLAYSALLPYIGVEAAAEERRALEQAGPAAT